ncbi:MAG TPA: TlpA disulfide reductase family protein [Bacillota bacterium]|nr:TlpA disulfide reductase family protein [Bacillota bacterium]
MKRNIIIVIIVGLIGWAIFDFVKSDDVEVTESEPNTTEEESSENTLDVEEEDEAALDPDNEAGEEGSDVAGLEFGNTPPDFELETLDGETAKLSDFVGEKVIVNFWASWCGPCRAEIPDMQKLYETHDVEILAVNLTETETNTDNITEFVDEFGMTFPVLLDESSVAATLYQIKPIPTTYLIDSNGKVHNKAFGALNYEQMVQQVEVMD